MPGKDSALKKKLIKEAVILTVSLVALAGGGYLLSTYDDSAQTEKQNQDNANNALRAEHDSVQKDLDSGVEVSSFYDAYAKHHNTSLTLKRDEVTQLMNTLREKDHLSNLSLTIAPLSDAPADIGPIKSGVMVKSDVKLTFDAMTDSSIYDFIADVEHKLPGIMVMQELKLTRKGDPSRAMLLDMAQHKLTPLISCEMSFAWVGIHPVSVGSENKGSSPMPGVPGFRGMRRAPD